MTYLSWAVLYEGDTDAAYLDLLIPRLMDEIVMVHGVRHSTIPTALRWTPSVGQEPG